MFSFVSITGIAVGDFVLAGASVGTPIWGRGWAVYSVMSGLLVGFIAVYGAMGPGHWLAGVFERLSTGANSLLSLLVLVRLLIQARGTARWTTRR